ncbi:MAG TPA: hypothetical protein VGQ83_26750 [Polyangia bacterium]|jgi:hypothetical protein
MSDAPISRAELKRRAAIMIAANMAGQAPPVFGPPPASRPAPAGETADQKQARLVKLEVEAERLRLRETDRQIQQLKAEMQADGVIK